MDKNVLMAESPASLLIALALAMDAILGEGAPISGQLTSPRRFALRVDEIAARVRREDSARTPAAFAIGALSVVAKMVTDHDSVWLTDEREARMIAAVAEAGAAMFAGVLSILTEQDGTGLPSDGDLQRDPRGVASDLLRRLVLRAQEGAGPAIGGGTIVPFPRVVVNTDDGPIVGLLGPTEAEQLAAAEHRIAMLKEYAIEALRTCAIASLDGTRNEQAINALLEVVRNVAGPDAPFVGVHGAGVRS